MIVTEFVSYRGKRVTFDQLKPHSMIMLEVKCDECGKVFKTTKYQLVRNGHELCQACALKLKRGKQLHVGSQYGRLTVIGPAEKSGYSVCECSCGSGKIVTVSNYSLISGKTRSCGCLRSENGKVAADKYLSQYQKGEQNWNRNGGVSPERNRTEKTAEYVTFRQSVLERDKHTCRVCGSTDSICVHHLRNYEDNPELRTSVDNAVCICRKCHREFHHRYGLHNTTPEQFEDFCT